jgi:hypothetical protein
VSFGPVSRLCAAQKPIISGNFNKNLKVLSAGEVRSQLMASKGKVDPNLTTKISKPEFFDFLKIAPLRLWDIAGIAGYAETRSKRPIRAPRAPFLPSMGLCNIRRN